MNKPLTTKQLLLLAFLVAGLLPALMVSTLGFYQARIALRAEIVHDMRTLNAAVANDIAASMMERMHNVHTWSQLGIMQDLQVGDVDKRLANFLSELKQHYGETYVEIAVTDLQDQIVASSNPQNIGLQVKADEGLQPAKFAHYTVWLGSLQANKLPISEPILHPETREPIGRLTAYFNWQMVKDSINKALPPPNAALLLDAQGNTLAQTENWQTVESGHEMRVESRLSDNPAMPDWTLRLEKLHSVASAPVKRLGYIFLGLLFATLAVAWLLAKPIANAITQPLEDLRRFVKTARPEANIHAPAGGTAEAQALSGAFETMLHELHESEQQLTRAAKLAVVGEMAAALSHEVRTPLGILRSSADLLQREPKLSQEGREVTGFIISETERLNKLVSSLIDAARPKPPDFKPLDIGALAQDVVAMLRPQIEAKKINVQLTAPETNIHADSGQMTQVLMNLLQNAIQILPEGGQIKLSIKPEDDYVELQIGDNGPGISAENQPHIFEPFFTQRAGGVGLGLAVVRQIVQAHSGSIHYAPSQLGGAGFTIRMPNTMKTI